MKLPPEATTADWNYFFREFLEDFRPTSGIQAIARCPFHADRTPSFSVNLEKGIWNCFGCGKKGNGIIFAREKGIPKSVVPGLSSDWEENLHAYLMSQIRTELTSAIESWHPLNDSATPKELKACGINFKPMTASELLKLKLPERVWIWKDYIAEGCLVILCGYPKAGKTTLAYHLLRAITRGVPFLGFPTQKCPVLVLAVEEHILEVRDRMKRLGINGEDVLVHSGPLKAKPQEMEAIKKLIEKKHVKLIIVDTLPRFWLVKEQNDASDMGANMEPILALARETGSAILLLFHLRKGGGEEGSDIRGSGDLFAIVDAAFNFYRRGDATNQRTLIGFSRYSRPQQLVISLEDDDYKALGNIDKVQAYEQKKKILAALANGDKKTSDEISKEIDVPAGTVRATLNLLIFSGDVLRTGEGARGKPFLFSLSTKDKKS